jgi:hypothetical protein
MTETGKVEISLNEYKDMSNRIDRLNDRIDLLNTEKGVLHSTITDLKKQLEKDSIDININSLVSGRDPWGDIKSKFTRVSSINANSDKAEKILSSATSNVLEVEIEKLKLELSFKENDLQNLNSQLKVLKETISTTERTLKDEYKIKMTKLEKEYSLLRDSFGAETDERRNKLEFDYVRKQKELEADAREWSARITELQDELEKERNNKTDRELEEKRMQEIATLNSRVVELEGEIDRLKSMNMFKRAWEFFTKRLAQKEAIKELERSKEAANKVINKFSYNPMRFWIC